MAIPQHYPVGGKRKKFPARSFNWLVDRVQELLAVKKSPPSVELAGRPGDALVHNATGELLGNAFAILEIEGPVIEPPEVEPESYAEPYEGQLLLRGIKPTASAVDGTKAIAILQESADSDGTPEAILDGWSWARVLVNSDGDTTCGPVEGETRYLSSGTGSISIRWKEPGTGEKWAIVTLGGGGTSGGLAVMAWAHVVEQAEAAFGDFKVDNPWEYIPPEVDPPTPAQWVGATPGWFVDQGSITHLQILETPTPPDPPTVPVEIVVQDKFGDFPTVGNLVLIVAPAGELVFRLIRKVC